MPQGKKSGGFLSGYAGNPIQRFARWGVDRALPGNQRAPDGTLNNRAVLLGSGARALGVIGSLFGGGPAASIAANKIGGRVVDRFSGQVDTPGQMTFQQYGGDGSVSVPDVGFNPGINFGTPQMGGQSPAAPQPWDGSLASNNPFGGQYGGNLGLPTMPAVNVRPMGGGLSFGGGQSGYNNGVGAGTGFGAFNVLNDEWGEAARGFGVGGMSGGARDMAMPAGPKFSIK